MVPATYLPTKRYFFCTLHCQTTLQPEMVASKELLALVLLTLSQSMAFEPSDTLNPITSSQLLDQQLKYAVSYYENTTGLDALGFCFFPSPHYCHFLFDIPVPSQFYAVYLLPRCESGTDSSWKCRALCCRSEKQERGAHNFGRVECAGSGYGDVCLGGGEWDFVWYS